MAKNMEKKTEEIKNVIAKGTDRGTTKATLVAALETALELVEDAKQFDPEAVKKAKSVKQVLTEVEELIENIEDIDVRLKEGDMTIKDAIVARKEQYTKIMKGIELKEAELKELYEVEVDLQKLVVLINAHNSVIKTQKEELATVKAEISDEKKAYNEEKENQENITRQDRKREQEEYNYSLKIVRRNEKDAWTQEQKSLKQEFTNTFEKRDTVLSEREQALVIMRDNAVATLEEADVKMANARQVEDDAKKATSTAVAIATSSIKKDLTSDHKLDMLSKDNQIALLAAKVESAEKQALEATERAKVAEGNAKDAYAKLAEVASKPTIIERKVESK